MDSNITTTEGGLSFNPNSDTTLQGNDRLTIGAGRTLTSAGALTLTGATTGLGALGLNAAEGVTLAGATTVAGNVTIDADTDRNGSGTFSVTAGGLSTSGADVSVTSGDINLGVTPSINAGAGTVSLQASKDLLPMQVGGTTAQPGGWNLLSAEVQRITAGTLIVGGTANGLLTVSALSSTNTTNLGEVILRSTGNGQGVQVDGVASFKALRIEADNGVRVNANLTTTVGDLVLNGDVDNTADGIDSIVFANGLVMIAGRDLLLSSATGNMTGAGALTLQAKRDTVLGSSLANSGALTLIADSDLDNSGTVRVAAGQTVAVTGTGLLRAQSADIDLQGALSNVAGEVRLQTHSGRTQALGTATGDWQLDNGEIGRITASLLTIGGAITGPEGGNILVSGVTSGSNGIQSWTLDAAGPANVGNTAQVQFDPADSSFRSLTVRAVDGIRVDANITTTEGGLSFNPNSNGAREGNDRLTIGAGKTLTSAGALTLTGETTGLGALGLNAAEGVTLDGATTVAGNVTIDADTDRNGSGTFSVT
ncbi:MAG: beta strand repeat-containing protein, partial [Planctomycetaceae bacterium]